MTSANLTEEPDEPKSSRPVLEAGRLGDELAQPSTMRPSAPRQCAGVMMMTFLLVHS
jgi:hypothetical protein